MKIHHSVLHFVCRVERVNRELKVHLVIKVQRYFELSELQFAISIYVSHT